MQNGRLLIGGVESGCGKTTIVNALLRLWQKQNISLSAFKCGPDYIDPLFHTTVLGIPSRNLDLFFTSANIVRAQLRAHTQGIAVIEGAMGFYDGIGISSETSAAEVARVTDTPAVLVVRPKGQALSLAALLYGFQTFQPNTLAGVILNGISKEQFSFYRAIVEKAGFPVFGYLPFVPEAEVPSRHLGLVTAQEIHNLQQKLDRLALIAETSLNTEGLLSLARTAPPLQESLPPVKAVCSDPVRIGVAQDEAFCFYYAENLDILKKLGAELLFFSPLHNLQLPDFLDGLYLGGGYPELYAETLSKNISLRDNIRRAVQNGLPTIAECGGFQYLHQSLNGYEMCGVFPMAARITERLQPFGYVTLTAQRNTMLCRAGETIRAHEFHYGVSDDPGDAFSIQKPSGRCWRGGYASDTLYAGYPHLYFLSDIAVAERFIKRCMKYKSVK